MTILPRASSRQRPSKALIVERLEPCNLNDIFFLGYTVVAAGRPANNLILKLEPTGPAVCPKCGSPPPPVRSYMTPAVDWCATSPIPG